MKLNEQEQRDLEDQLDLVIAQCNVCRAMIPFMVKDENYQDSELAKNEFRIGRFVVRDTLMPED